MFDKIIGDHLTLDDMFISYENNKRREKCNDTKNRNIRGRLYIINKQNNI